MVGDVRYPTICSNTTGTNKKLKNPTYNEHVDEVEAQEETCAIMQQILTEKNLMSPLPRSSQDDTSEGMKIWMSYSYLDFMAGLVLKDLDCWMKCRN
ncbi:hypothetical protein R6Q59_025166 [Mikania micrantha]